MEIEPVPSLIDLGSAPLAHILSFLAVEDIGRASQACTALRDAASSDLIWKIKALERYPPKTVHLQSYCSYRSLLRDDNARQASLLLPLKDVACEFKHNHADYFFECTCVALQWNRSDGSFRLFLDARGEVDLRHPSGSSMGVTVHRDCGPSRRALRAESTRLAATRDTLRAEIDRLAPAVHHDPDAASRHHATMNALTLLMRRMLRISRDLSDAPALGFVDLVAVSRPSREGHVWIDARPGHFRGCLHFTGLDRTDNLPQELPDSYAAKQRVALHGLDLVFCFANPVPVMPHGHMVDYHSEVILHVPPGKTLLQVFRSEGRYVAHDEPLQTFQAEGEAEQRRRWEHVRPDVLHRQNPPWYV